MEAEAIMGIIAFYLLFLFCVACTIGVIAFIRNVF